MGGASSYSTQFLSHSSPRGPPPGMVSSRPGLPPTSTGLYPSHPAQTQKMSQHGGYPGGQQGLKRSFHSEVGGDVFTYYTPYQSSLDQQNRTGSNFNTSICSPFSQGFPVQQYGSSGMSGYPTQPLQYPTGPQQRCAPSPSYPTSRMPLMGQYPSGSHSSVQFPPGAAQPNPPQYYKVFNYSMALALMSVILSKWVIAQ